MNHREAWAMLEQYLDGALPAVERWALTAHLDECAVCRKQVAQQARLRGLVRERLAAVTVPAGLPDRLRAALAAETSQAPRPLRANRSAPAVLRFASVLAPALVALWLLVNVSGIVGNPTSDLTGELAATHALFAHDETLLDVVGDAPTVDAWFHNKVGLAVSAPELDGYEIVGGRLIALDGRPVAQLVYESQPDEVYLSLLRFTGGQQPTALSVDQKGTISMVTWPAGKERAALIAALPQAELMRLAGNLATWSDPAHAAAS